ncbi:MAG: glycosyltransferase [Candidatus Pacebacteria bacterium]|jgi:glycosyltransferase involved in cell wall biosynthesis|nr:glycosyltransferase [Candidatus Paceibacterota bacterium]
MVSESVTGKRRLKVLFITGSYPTKDHPADNVFVREHAKAAKINDDVRVLYWIQADSGARRLWQIEEESDPEVAQGIVTYRLFYRKPRLPGTSLATYLWCVGRAFRQIKRSGFTPDVIHAHVYVSGLAAVAIGRRLGIPVAVTEHWSIFSRKALPASEILKARLAFGLADAVLPVSQPLMAAIQSYGIKANFRVIPNAVDTSIFFPESKCGIDGRPKRIVFVGNLLPEKGIGDILEVLVKLRERSGWQMHIFGGGPRQGDYEEMARQLGIGDRAIFHGLQPKQEVARMMRQCDFMLHPSYGETFGASTVEALACGIPVVAYDIPAFRRTISANRGILVPLGDKSSLAAAVVRMLDHCQDYAPKELNRYAADNFSLAAVGKQLHEAYCQISKKR